MDMSQAACAPVAQVLMWTSQLARWACKWPADPHPLHCGLCPWPPAAIRLQACCPSPCNARHHPSRSVLRYIFMPCCQHEGCHAKSGSSCRSKTSGCSFPHEGLPMPPKMQSCTFASGSDGGGVLTARRPKLSLCDAYRHSLHT